MHRSPTTTMVARVRRRPRPPVVEYTAMIYIIVVIEACQGLPPAGLGTRRGSKRTATGPPSPMGVVDWQSG